MNIKDLRIKAGLTQVELAEKLGVGQSCVAGWETGAKVPRTMQLPEIAKALGCTVNDLYRKEETA